MKTAAASTVSHFSRSMCRRCGNVIRRGDPIFLWDEVWVCGGCNGRLVGVDGLGLANTDWIIALFDEVPIDYREKVFRALTLAFHPDHGTDASVMKRLLEVRDRWEEPTCSIRR